MRGRSWIGLVAACALAAPALVGQGGSDLQKVRDLVRAGALPRNALVEAESADLERKYRETLSRTLLSETLEESEIRTMLDAARGLERIVRDRFERVMAQVEAGAIPANRLQEAKDSLAAAERQSELADSRAHLVREMGRMIEAESYQEEIQQDLDAPYRFYGFTEYEQDLIDEVGEMYYMAFGSVPPVTAMGSTPFHRALGLDHTGRIDVGLHPDSEEGMFLIYLLENFGIGYMAFRTAIPGQSSGPHIHIGPPSDPIEEPSHLDEALP